MIRGIQASDATRGGEWTGSAKPGALRERTMRREIVRLRRELGDDRGRKPEREEVGGGHRAVRCRATRRDARSPVGNISRLAAKEGAEAPSGEGSGRWAQSCQVQGRAMQRAVASR